MSAVRKLVVLTDGTRIEVAEQGITFLEMRTIAQVLLNLADGEIQAAAAAGTGLLVEQVASSPRE